MIIIMIAIGNKHFFMQLYIALWLYIEDKILEARSYLLSKQLFLIFVKCLINDR